MRFFDWVRATLKKPEIARKFWGSVAGFVAYVLAAYGIQVPEEQLDNVVTILFLLTASGVWAVPNKNK